MDVLACSLCISYNHAGRYYCYLLFFKMLCDYSVYYGSPFLIQGDHIEWLACALYIACRSSSTQTVEGRDHSGNNISLTQILRATKVK